VIDQIAAGEVVERPASVVKELVENSLDAGATRVRVEVRDGGLAWIAVTDDGVGLSPGDAHLALQRHATSKLSSASDLLQISTFGFRGEALPSIASVSRMRVRTRRRGAPSNEAGYEIRLDAGRIVAEGAIGAPEGTRIEVADLFSSVPARRKFAKAPATEWTHIADRMTRFGLALPGVHFELQRDDRAPIVWPATASSLERIAAVLSEKEAEALVSGELEDAAGHVQVFVSTPEHTRPNANGLYLFVNGRPVRDKVVRQAVLESYRDWLPRGRYPTAVVFLTVQPDRVDVNVHPAKWEMRFAEPRDVHRVIRRAIRAAIAERSWLGGTRLASPPTAAPARVDVEPQPGRVEAPRTDWIFASQTRDLATGEPAVAASTGGGPVESATTPRIRFGELRAIGQLRASYLLVEGERGLLLVDQHAAHERVIYERLRAQALASGVQSQRLLAPVVVELEAAAAAALAEHARAVGLLGFELEPFSESAVLLRAVPSELDRRAPDELVRELARELSDEGVRGELERDATRWLPVLDRAFATLACHAARRFGDALPLDEQRALLRELDAIPWAPTCPHGRPVAVAVDFADIERRFARR